MNIYRIHDLHNKLNCPECNERLTNKKLVNGIYYQYNKYVCKNIDKHKCDIYISYIGLSDNSMKFSLNNIEIEFSYNIYSMHYSSTIGKYNNDTDLYLFLEQLIYNFNKYKDFDQHVIEAQFIINSIYKYQENLVFK